MDTGAPMKLLAGNSNLPLSTAIADYLEIPLTKASVRRFADEEIFVEVLENVRGEDVFVVQSTSYPVNDNLMEMLIMIDALKRASARRITRSSRTWGTLGRTGSRARARRSRSSSSPT